MAKIGQKRAFLGLKWLFLRLNKGGGPVTHFYLLYIREIKMNYIYIVVGPFFPFFCPTPIFGFWARKSGPFTTFVKKGGQR